MSEPVLTALFVSPTGNTLPTTGTSANLTGGQLGVFLPDYSPATVGNVGTAKYIFFAQGRNIYAPGEETKKSNWIYPENLIRWYYTSGNTQVNLQVTKITNLQAGCEEDISLTLRLSSFYTDVGFDNGLTRTVMVTTPCCDCGANPCDTLSAQQTQQLAQDLAQAVNSDPILSTLVTAGTQGTGLTTAIVIQAKATNSYGQGTSTDVNNYPYQFDRVYFWTFIQSGPDLTTDYSVADACNEVADVNVIQRGSYPRNLAGEVKQIEKDYFSYLAEYKDLYGDADFNGEFLTYVDSSNAYDLYYLNFWQPKLNGMQVGQQRQDEWVILAIPKGDAAEAGTLAILTGIFGAPDNHTSSPTSTTSFTTSSTTTLTTTIAGNTP